MLISNVIYILICTMVGTYIGSRFDWTIQPRVLKCNPIFLLEYYHWYYKIE